LSYLADTQTDRQTKFGKKITSLIEVTIWNSDLIERSVCTNNENSTAESERLLTLWHSCRGSDCL